MYHILLDSSVYPRNFYSLEITSFTNAQKQMFAENMLIDKIKKENKKIGKIDIVYCDIESMFPNTIGVKSIGLLVEEIEAKNNLSSLLSTQNCFINKILSKTSKSLYRIKFYLFFSNYSEKTRSAFVSQTMFPQVIDFVKRYIQISSYEFTNHPVYFVNMLNKKITAPVLIKELSTLLKSGVRYIELFDHNTISDNVRNCPLEIFLQKYYLPVSGIVDNKVYKLDINNKILKLKTDKLYPSTIVGDKSYVKLNGSKWEFEGSSEKFYWNTIFWLAIVLTKEGYSIDYYDLELYLSTNSKKFFGSDKIIRFKLFLEYLKKINKE